MWTAVGEECGNRWGCVAVRLEGGRRWRFNIDRFRVCLVKKQKDADIDFGGTVESSGSDCLSVNITPWSTGSSKW